MQDSGKKYIQGMMFVILSVIAGIFVVIGIIRQIDMPYDRWLAENIPPWLSVISSFLLGISIVIVAIPERSFLANTFALIMLPISITVLKPTYSKANDVNTAIFLISCLIALATKIYLENKGFWNRNKRGD